MTRQQKTAVEQIKRKQGWSGHKKASIIGQIRKMYGDELKEYMEKVSG